MFKRWQKMRDLGVLGMNQRNISYISRYNSRRLYPLVDNKLLTKELAIEHNVQVPELLGVIRSQHDVNGMMSQVRDYSGFCIKPAKGSGGKGILVISRNAQGHFVRSNGTEVDDNSIRRHTSNILAGLFSLGGAPDVAIIETLIEPDPAMMRFSYQGIPDIRIIVFRGIPVMAMMRLACAVSGGKANLHQGAVGVGVDIATGRAVSAVQANRNIERHPDNQQDLFSLEIPDWNTILELACSCADMTGLGYIGVDLVVDGRRGPLMLELNARPGLSIQIANRQGLLPRLRKVEQIEKPHRMSISQRIDFARHFSTSVQ